MYIVARTFRDKNGVFSVGSVVEPTEVHAFKSRFHQKHIIDVSEQNIDVWAKFFKNKAGIDLADVLKEYLETGTAPKVVSEVSLDLEAPVGEVTNESAEIDKETDAATEESAEIAKETDAATEEPVETTEEPVETTEVPEGTEVGVTEPVVEDKTEKVTW